jgi:ankyrin repeat protein
MGFEYSIGILRFTPIVFSFLTFLPPFSLPLSQNGASPLQRASEEGHVHVVKFLLSKGANINIRNEVR